MHKKICSLIPVLHNWETQWTYFFNIRASNYVFIIRLLRNELVFLTTSRLINQLIGLLMMNDEATNSMMQGLLEQLILSEIVRKFLACMEPENGSSMCS
jgi:hypothetical protein